jgi:hypothetical protein
MKNFTNTDVFSCADGIFSLMLHARIFGFCGLWRMDGAEAGIIACNTEENMGRLFKGKS